MLSCQHCLNYYCHNPDTMWEIYRIAVLNLKVARPPIKDPNKSNLKVEDMVLLKNHTPTTASDYKYKPSFIICKQLSDNTFDVQDSTGKIRWVSI